MARFFAALVLVSMPLAALAQEKAWVLKFPPVYAGGTSYEYVSPGMLEHEIAVVSVRYSARVSEVAFVQSDDVYIQQAVQTTHQARFIRAIFFEIETDFLELAAREQDGHLASRLPEVEVYDICYGSSTGIEPRRLHSSAELKIIVLSSDAGCADGPYNSAYLRITMDRQFLFRQLSGTREIYRHKKELRYNGMGIRYERTDGGDYTIFFSLLDTLDKI